MTFSSLEFIFGFLPVTLIVFAALSRADHRWSKAWLCLASLVFYGWWDVRWVPVLLVSIAFNYLVGYGIILRANAGRTAAPLLGAGIGANLLALAYYKYLGAVLGFFGAQGLVPLATGLPLGISFFTFTQIAFLIDANQGFRQKYTFVNYVLFVTFFPHLIAGPIVHHRDLMPQFEEDRNYRLHWRELAVGVAIFSIGLCKKTLIADNVAELAGRLLGPGHATPLAAWVGALAYSMQLYFDFSGYSDMAIGLGRLFGIKLPINFDSPYRATSIIEFWQRWHITLTRFLTAYLYNPMALALVRRRAAAGLPTSKRVSRTLRGFLELIALPTCATMLIAGIWHGAGLQFVVFGALHGAYISINHAWRSFAPKELGWAHRLPRRARATAAGVLVYLCVLVAQIFFHAASVGDALTVLSDMAGLPGPASGNPATLVGEFTVPVAAVQLLYLVLAFVIVWFAPNTQQLMLSYEPALELGRHPRPPRFPLRFSAAWAFSVGVILFLGLLNIRTQQPFIYFQF